MITINIPCGECWDEERECFVYSEKITLKMEHSLLSISKWEEKYKKPFLAQNEKTPEEIMDYLRFMTINQVDDKVYTLLNSETIEAIGKYINDDRTATWFREDEDKKGGGRKVVTSERIYAWMVILKIPFETQKWHLSRLLTLIRVVSIEKQPPKKMGKMNTMKSNAALNAARRKRFNSKG